MILRHFTHRRFLQAIVARGGLSVQDLGGHYLQFEFNPLSDRLRQTLYQSYMSKELSWGESDTVALILISSGCRRQASKSLSK